MEDNVSTMKKKMLLTFSLFLRRSCVKPTQATNKQIDRSVNNRSLLKMIESREVTKLSLFVSPASGQNDKINPFHQNEVLTACVGASVWCRCEILSTELTPSLRSSFKPPRTTHTHTHARKRMHAPTRDEDTRMNREEIIRVNTVSIAAPTSNVFYINAIILIEL